MLLLIRMQRCRDQEGGYSLVVTIAMTLILTILLVTAAVISKVDTASTRASGKSNTGFYAAEAGLNIRAQQVRAQFDGFNRPTGNAPQDIDGDGEIWDTCDDPAATAAEQGTGAFACNSMTFQNQDTLTFLQENPNNPTIQTIPAGEPFAGLNAQEFQYNVLSVSQDSQNLPSAILGMTFRSRLVPLFQFAIFYENDGDFTIPPNMTINGRVHSNNDLYLNSANAGVTLRINGQVTTAGNLYRGEKANVAATQICSGNVSIEDESGTPLALACNGTAITEYRDTLAAPFDTAPWGQQIGFLNNRLDVPPPSLLDPTPGSQYWDAADMRVVLELDASNNPVEIEIRNANNTRNNAATNALQNSCPVASTVLQPEGDGSTDYERDDTVLQVNSTAGFSAGDAITIGTDFDSNVIPSDGPDPAGGQIQIRRRLGHDAYQPAIVVDSTDANNLVRKAVVSTSDTFYNYREKHVVNNVSTQDGPNAFAGLDGSNIRMLNVDVRALFDCAQTQNLMDGKALDETSDGGLVWYFTVEGPESNIDRSVGNAANLANPVGSRYGVRLYNGRHLSSTIAGAPEIQGLTIASDQAVYVQGDYNLRDDAATAGIDEGDDPATAMNERWRPAAVLTDSVNVLSEAWALDDINHIRYDGNNRPTIQTFLWSNFQGTPPRTAPTETSQNVAFLSATEITGGANGEANQGGTGSGGINNFPRFHEHWSGAVPFNYRGSLVSLSEPRRVNSPFCGSAQQANCNIYTPPIRNWDYDVAFDQAQNLPPLSPRAVYLRQELFQRQFSRISTLPQSNPIAAKPFGFAMATLPNLQPTFIF